MLRLSTYRLWPSAKRVSKISELLPDPETPVITVSASRGISTLICLRLCSVALWILMCVFALFRCFLRVFMDTVGIFLHTLRVEFKDRPAKKRLKGA